MSKYLGNTNIELGTKNWNPVCGCANHLECYNYCWSRLRVAPRLEHRCKLCSEFKLHLHPERIEQPLNHKKPERILVCWTGDLFSDISPHYELDTTLQRLPYYEAVFEFAKQAPQHKYLFLTKCPQNIPRYQCKYYLDNWWFGTSISGDSSKEHDRIFALVGWNGHILPNRFLMIEPFFYVALPWTQMEKMEWIVLGVVTGVKEVKYPRQQDIQQIIDFCKESRIPLFLKNNLLKLFPDLPKIQEIPKELEV